jgi:ABC-type sugar transport system permease subunit
MNRKHTHTLHARHNLAGYLFLSPLLILFIGLLGYCFYFLITSSFQHVTITFRERVPVGLANYFTVIRDGTFWKALFNTFLLSASSIFFGLTIGFFIAIILNFKLKGKKFFHSMFFIPSMLPIALMAAVFSSMLEYRDGTLNVLLRTMNLDFLAQRWLADPNIAMWSVCSVSIFLIGIPIMYYTADLTTLNTSILEAATIDGANMRHQLFFIIYPIMKNTHRTIILSLLLGGFREMERVLLMTNGGPGDATQIIGTYIFRASRSAGTNIGLVCAAYVLVLLVAFSISLLQMKLSPKER